MLIKVFFGRLRKYCGFTQSLQATVDIQP